VCDLENAKKGSLGPIWALVPKGKKKNPTKSAFILKTIYYMRDIPNWMAPHRRKLILILVFETHLSQ
jgi:hypothetical protein